MKWTDLALVFVTIFCAGAVVLLLSARARAALLYSDVMYDRILDRVAEDAMTDVVAYEDEDGAVLEEEEILRRLWEGLCVALQAQTAEERLLVAESVKAVVLTGREDYRVYVPTEDGWVCTKEEAFDREAVCLELETVLPGRLSVAYTEENEWYREIGTLQLYLVFEAPYAALPAANGICSRTDTSYLRLVRAGARVEKRKA